MGLVVVVVVGEEEEEEEEEEKVFALNASIERYLIVLWSIEGRRAPVVSQA